ncbi:MAG: DNA polymerase III subunit gamma/tau [Candidatus Paceibacterota bacterium]|jgi:DNA polymerase-3 subunit gamma/tau
MSKQTLYLKYRPQKFNEVLGQEQVTEVIETALKNKGLVHAYLFAGPRGTGKTSVARLLAKTIGCSERDLSEIDAASNRGIDEIRALREAVGTLPFESPYKVYIIDEVHMLTKDAFNALLKTLEEPPAHVVFILATTEPHKVIETIISRCQTHFFKKPSLEILKKMILNVSQKENISLSEEVSSLIAFLGDGSFRDTLGILQKVISYSPDKEISLDEVRRITGAPSFELVSDFVLSLTKGDLESALAVLDQVAEQSIEMKVFLKMVMREMRFIILVVFAPRLKTRIFENLTIESKIFVAQPKSEILSGVKRLASVLREFLDIYGQLGGSFVPQAPIELALIKILKDSKPA